MSRLQASLWFLVPKQKGKQEDDGEAVLLSSHDRASEFKWEWWRIRENGYSLVNIVLDIPVDFAPVDYLAYYKMYPSQR